ncbi:MAG: lipoyl(octanoyl) transferase LipB [Xanthomonadales bacterium]|nr:Octanoyltransferase [Xanthomonadales bacterium]MCC6593868.1 lipoyl(octanoyl) transferase LipB [Xanthomonadales bacterium]MCE7931037.1 lipoyl(octanoyl) transferase LipB [Xanthomonadales bacterium PRO6]
MHPLTAFWLGRQPYAPVWQAMRALTDARDADTPDQLWLLEHDPVFTLGQAGKPEHVLAPGDIPVLPVDRGGQVTYHGPGQLVAYPLLDLRRLGIGVRELVQRLEQVGIELLANFGIDVQRREGAPGLYVDGRKILAIGIRVRRGCSFHGIALNATMDLEPFRRINPCGYRGLEVTQIADLARTPVLPELAAQYLHHFARVFGHQSQPLLADPSKVIAQTSHLPMVR